MQSRVWFTISHGILNEIYFPFVDRPNTRDFGLLVADGAEFFSEEKRDAVHAIAPIACGFWPGRRHLPMAWSISYSDRDLN